MSTIVWVKVLRVKHGVCLRKSISHTIPKVACHPIQRDKHSKVAWRCNLCSEQLQKLAQQCNHEFDLNLCTARLQYSSNVFIWKVAQYTNPLLKSETCCLVWNVYSLPFCSSFKDSGTAIANSPNMADGTQLTKQKVWRHSNNVDVQVNNESLAFFFISLICVRRLVVWIRTSQSIFEETELYDSSITGFEFLEKFV